MASVMVLMDSNTRGTRQGNIKHAIKTRSITLLFITNVACIFLTLGLLVSLTATSQTWGVYELMKHLTCWWVDDTKYDCVEVPTMALLQHSVHGGNLARANPKGKSPSV
jgi:hypothetical protein